MYGGLPRAGFTEAFADDSGTVVTEARLINYIGWPYKLALTAEQIADGFGITRFVAVAWPGEGSATEDDAWAIAESATHTRRAIAAGGLRDLDGNAVLRPAGLIALGGQTSGFSGFLPGVAEEIAVALHEGIPVYVLGGFGGAAEQVVALMEGSDRDELTVNAFMSNPRYQALTRAADERAELTN
jgi:hypothetical protein